MKKQKKQTVISNNVINVRVFDDKVEVAINDVARALLNLTEMFKSVNVTGIKVVNSKEE